MSHNAWIKVTTLRIVNCFKKSGMGTITTNKALKLDLPDVPIDFSGLQIDRNLQFIYLFIFMLFSDCFLSFLVYKKVLLIFIKAFQVFTASLFFYILLN